MGGCGPGSVCEAREQGREQPRASHLDEGEAGEGSGERQALRRSEEVR